MSVVATSVFLLFALIVLGFILGKRNIIHKESIPDFSTLVLKVTMPVTVFCSIIDQDRSQLFAYGIQTFVTIILLHVCAFLIGLLLVKVMKVACYFQTTVSWEFLLHYPSSVEKECF